MSGDEAPDSPTAIELILNDKSLFSVTKAQVNEWSELAGRTDQADQEAGLR